MLSSGDLAPAANEACLSGTLSKNTLLRSVLSTPNHGKMTAHVEETGIRRQHRARPATSTTRHRIGGWPRWKRSEAASTKISCKAEWPRGRISYRRRITSGVTGGSQYPNGDGRHRHLQQRCVELPPSADTRSAARNLAALAPLRSISYAASSTRTRPPAQERACGFAPEEASC